MQPSPLPPTAAAAAYMPLTIAQLVLIAIGVGVVIIAIWWGMRLAARRRAAEQANEDRVNTGDSLPAPEIVATPSGDGPLSGNAPAPASSPPPATGSEFPLTTIKGLGPKIADQLTAMGITCVGEIAALSLAEAEALDARLGTFSGRIARDRFVAQAKLLAAGDRAGYEAAFGKLGQGETDR
ncbi:hypothetical protein [uncultured Sphingomonas sp.]|uniref:hypothetical protein n=1 Tax=uncultured Sphingomonas sp. TaxID=158754 RepID=UPI0035CC024D